MAKSIYSIGKQFPQINQTLRSSDLLSYERPSALNDLQ